MLALHVSKRFLSMRLLLMFCSVCSWLMTDDKGKVCKARELDFSTGCCTAGEQHSCGM